MRFLLRPKISSLSRPLSVRNVCHSNSDIVIVGGGLVGTSLACNLASNPLLRSKKVTLIEAGPKSKKQDKVQNEYSNRVSALNPSTCQFLDKLGAWPIIKKQKRCHPFHKMYVWESCSDASIEFKNGFHEGPVAHIVENDVVTDALTRIMHDFANIKPIYGAKIEQVDLKSQVIKLENGDSIETELLVGADGANSIVRRSMGVNYVSQDYGQMGIVGTITLDNPTNENDTAYQKFLPSGPVALLPLNGTMSSLVWTVDKHMVQELRAKSPEELAEELNKALSNSGEKKDVVVDTLNSALGAVLRPLRGTGSRITAFPPPVAKRVDNVAAFPLGFGHPERYVSHRTALVGDAAHRVHPMAGQGVNLGYGDVMSLVSHLESDLRQGNQFATYECLCDYETERMRHNLPIMSAIDGLQKLYCTDNTVLVLARSLGLQVVNSNEMLKKYIMAGAS